MRSKFTKFIVVGWGICLILILFLPSVIAVVTTGGTQTIDGDYVIHTFKTNDTFGISSGTITNATILIVGGGGGGGTQGGGGGGAGGVYYLTGINLTSNQTVIIGAGASGGTGTANGINGYNSSFGSYVALGGGAGGSQGQINGSAGGSGGGGSNAGGLGANTGLGGINISNQGYAGAGCGANCGDSWYCTGGGGGAATVGQVPTHSQAGYGGNGTAYSINGTTIYYGGGGGGTCYSATNGLRGIGGLGGGADGWAPDGSVKANNGTANTGGGGGGGYTNAIGGYGGSGIVIIRYSDATFNNVISIPVFDWFNSTLAQFYLSMADYDLNKTHSGNMTIRINCSKDADGVSSVNHNLTLIRPDNTIVEVMNNNFTCAGDNPIQIIYWTHDINDGDYRLNLTAISVDTPTDIKSILSPIFHIDNDNPTMTIITPPSDLKYNITNITNIITLNYTYNATDFDLNYCYSFLNATTIHTGNCNGTLTFNAGLGNYELFLWAMDKLGYGNNYTNVDTNLFSVCFIDYTCTHFAACAPGNIGSCTYVSDVGGCDFEYVGNLSDYDDVCTYVPANVLDFTETSEVFFLAILVFFWLGLIVTGFIFNNFALISFAWIVGILLGLFLMTTSFVFGMAFILFSTVIFISKSKFRL